MMSNTVPFLSIYLYLFITIYNNKRLCLLTKFEYVPLFTSIKQVKTSVYENQDALVHKMTTKQKILALELER